MKRCFLGSMMIFLLIIPMTTLAQDLSAQLDQLDDEQTLKNYEQSVAMCSKALQEKPNDFGLNWRCARAHRWVGELNKRKNVKDWEDICAKQGKEGMKYAQKAIDLQPDKPDGYYWYGLNVGIYSDGVSILKAISEGLKDKTQKSFEKVYALDKNYEKAGAILALARFWYVLPWPMNDKDLSLKYFREYQKTPYFGPQHEEGPIYFAELLIDLGGDKNEAEARKLLDLVKNSDKPYFRDWAKRLLAELD